MSEKIFDNSHVATLGAPDGVRLGKAEVAALGAERLARIVLDAACNDSALLAALRAAVAGADGAGADGVGDGATDEPHMVGTSAAMRRVFETIRKFASVNAPVLITGETGTGKELVAQAIHERSAMAAGPFVAINCAALPATLISSELFGHEKGSFTGAYQRKIGRIEAAAGGSIFLDEIGDLPPETQVHLLRFLQDKTIDRIGGRQPIKVDVRIVSATNTDLERAIREGRFREDLFYRLNVLRLELPPLRARGDDLDLLVHYFMRSFAQEMGRPVGQLSAAAARAIRGHAWPGNVRELISCLRRALTMSEGALIEVEDLGLPLDEAPLAGFEATAGGLEATAAKTPLSLGQARQTIEKDLLGKALAHNANNIKRTAEQLGVSRVTVYRLLEKYQIDPRRESRP
jgi:DNA-binding NtrC family response regulator